MTCRRPSRCYTVSSLSPPERCTVTESLGDTVLGKGNMCWLMSLICQQSSLTKSHLRRGWRYDVDNHLTCIRRAVTLPCHPGIARKIQTCYKSGLHCFLTLFSNPSLMYLTSSSPKSSSAKLQYPRNKVELTNMTPVFVIIFTYIVLVKHYSSLSAFR